MSSGSHLSTELQNLIKAIGETRSKQEEDKIIIKEAAQLKVKLQENNIAPKKLKEHLIRGIYIEMLGHDASFAHIHAVNLTQSKNLALKKMGYLCCSLFLDNESELLILLVATLQKDLASSNVHIVVIALTAVAKLISKNFITPIVEPVLKLLTHNTDIIRKKALMVIQILKQINPDCISDNEYEERMRRGIQDKEPSVMGAAFNLYHEELKRGQVQKYKGQASNFVAMLKQIIEHKLNKDYDYHRFPAPWLQIKLLQILALLGANDLKVSEQIYEILGSTLRRADDTTINIGYAVTYQCVKTIAQLYPNPSLLEQAANSVSRFLKSDNNNLKYLGINALTQIVSINPKYVVEHQMTVVDCLESQDDTLKKETLELLFRMTNENNFEVIIQKLINFLKTSSDPGFRKDLFTKISLLNERLAPTQEWFIRTANIVFEHGSEFIDNDVLNNFFKLLIDNYNDIGNEFGEFIVAIYLELLQKPNLSDNIIKLVCWVVGEIGSQVYDQDTAKLNELTNNVLMNLENEFEDSSTISWILSSLAKLQSARGFKMYDQTRAIFSKFQLSKNLDCQQRSIDFLTLAKYNAALKRSTKVTVDKDLNFLNQFVQAEKIKGAKSYDQSLQIKAAALGGGNQQEFKMNFGPYDNKKPSQTFSNSSNTANTQPEGSAPSQPTGSSNGLKVTGKTIWDENGLVQEQPAPAPVAKTKPTMGMGSGGLTGTQTKPTYTGLGNSQFGGQGQAAQTQSTYVPPPIKPIVKEDPNLKEKQRLANSLFGPVVQQQPQTQGQKKGITAQQTQAQQKTNVNQPPQPQQQQPKATLNLLELDDSQQQQKQSMFGKTQIKSQAQNLPNQSQFPQQGQTFGQQQQYPTQPQQYGIQQGNLPNTAQSQPQYNIPTQPFQPQPQQFIQAATQKRFLPTQLTTETYGSLWEQLPKELDLTLNTKIRSENDYKNMIAFLNLNIVDIDDQDIISAGVNSETKNLILLYGNYEQNGQINFQIKSKDQQDVQYLVQTIKTNFI